LEAKRHNSIAVCFVIALATFWAAQGGYGGFWARIGAFAILTGAMSG
jgi:hypothetical protein